MTGMGHVACGSYCTGAVAGIKTQLEKSREETRKDAVAHGKSGALIKLDGREMEVRQLMDKMRLRKNKAQSKAQFDSNAYEAGKRKGENLHLGKAMNSTGGAAKALSSGK
jgi:hypothetical protein